MARRGAQVEGGRVARMGLWSWRRTNSKVRIVDESRDVPAEACTTGSMKAGSVARAP